MRKLPLLFFIPLLTYAQDNEPPESPEQIQQELNDAEDQYKKAKEMFNPWYTGPLITPSASMMPPGQANIQPYVFVADNYAQFNEDRHSIKLPHKLISLNVSSIVQCGLTDTCDFILGVSGVANWQNGHFGGGFQDLNTTLGFPITRETLYLPKIKFSVKETFPTGKYEDLSLNGLNLNSTGGGSYQTQFSLAFGKLIWWTYPYPMNVRLFLGYNIATPVHVRNFNAYGGGFGTRGKVRPGNTFTADFGYELSFTQRWVFAIDAVYTAQNRTKFHGTAGVDALDAPASVGGGYNDNLSLAPAIEYNWNENLGVLGGAWFSVYGRNSTNFAQAVLSVVYTW